MKFRDASIHVDSRADSRDWELTPHPRTDLLGYADIAGDGAEFRMIQNLCLQRAIPFCRVLGQASIGHEQTPE